MSREVKKSTNFFPGIDTEFDRLGDASSFSASITDLATGASVVNGGSGTFSELIKDDNSHTGTTNGAAVIGDQTITLAGGSTLVAGDAFNDGAGNLYYISSVSGSTIGLKSALVADIADATDLNFVGNTGLYYVECNIANTGEYMVSVSHPDYGHIALKYVVVDNTLDDSVANANVRFDNIDNKLDSLGAKATMKAIA